MQKIKTIIKKEWAEVFKNRLVLSTVLFLPLLFTAIPLILLYTTRDAGIEGLSTDIPSEYEQFCPDGLTGGECFQVFMVNQYMILFMMTPLIIPINIAAYSIVGEKTTRSLEPLLATPITTIELLIGKTSAAVIPAVLATWFGFIIYIIGAWILVRSPEVISALLDPMWWIAVVVVGPLLAILAVNVSLMVSSRVNEPRVAEQLSALVILPVLGLFFAQIAGLLIINRKIVLLLSLILLIIDILMIFLAVRLFQRETILTRWK